jgi:hypothetical protein
VRIQANQSAAEAATSAWLLTESGERFIEGRVQLNTAGLTFLNLDWANRPAATLACVDCGRLEWFLADPEERH